MIPPGVLLRNHSTHQRFLQIFWMTSKNFSIAFAYDFHRNSCWLLLRILQKFLTNFHHQYLISFSKEFLQRHFKDFLKESSRESFRKFSGISRWVRLEYVNSEIVAFSIWAKSRRLVLICPWLRKLAFRNLEIYLGILPGILSENRAGIA